MYGALGIENPSKSGFMTVHHHEMIGLPRLLNNRCVRDAAKILHYVILRACPTSSGLPLVGWESFPFYFHCLLDSWCAMHLYVHAHSPHTGPAWLPRQTERTI